jgi:hypothetical protein
MFNSIYVQFNICTYIDAIGPTESRPDRGGFPPVSYSERTATSMRRLCDRSRATGRERQVESDRSRATGRERQVESDRSRATATGRERQVESDRSRATGRERQVESDSDRSRATATGRERQVESDRSRATGRERQVESDRSRATGRKLRAQAIAWARTETPCRSGMIDRAFQLATGQAGAMPTFPRRD